MTRWILASASPRRRELLQQMGLHDFEILPATGEEKSPAKDPSRYVRELSLHKAKEVYLCVQNITAEQELLYEWFDEDCPPEGRAGVGLSASGAASGTEDTVCVIGADTIVVCDGKILGKPKDRQDAACMIRMLQGNRHEVITGTTLIYGSAGADGRRHAYIDAFDCLTNVYVASMDDEEIRRYLATGEADDKAGAYGIQGAFGIFVEGIEGDYYNVVGLPIHKLYQAIQRGRLEL